MLAQTVSIFYLVLFFSYYPLFDSYDPYAHLFSDPASMTLWIEPILHASTQSLHEKVQLPTYFCSRFRLEPIQNTTNVMASYERKTVSSIHEEYREEQHGYDHEKEQEQEQDLAFLLQREIRQVQRLERIKKMAVFSVGASHGLLLSDLQFHSLS